MQDPGPYELIPGGSPAPPLARQTGVYSPSTLYQAQGPQAYGEGDEEPGSGEELRTVLYALRRHWLLIVLCAAVSSGIAAVRTYRKIPVYESSAQVQLAKEAPDPAVAKYMTYWEGLRQEYMNTQMAIIRSEEVAREALKQSPELRRELLADVYGAGTPGGDEGQGGAGAPAGQSYDDDALAYSLLSGLTVSPVPDTYLVRIGYRSSQPERCARFANAIAGAYIASFENRTSDKRVEIRAKVLDQVERLAEKVSQSEQLLEQRTKAAQTKSQVSQRYIDELTQRVSDNQDELAAIVKERIEIDAQLDTIGLASRELTRLELVPSIAKDSQVSALLERLGSLEIEIAEMEDDLGEDAFEMVRARGKYQKLQALLQERFGEIRRELNLRLKSLSAQEQEFRERGAELQATRREAEIQGAELKKLEDELKDNKELYQQFVDRLEDIDYWGPLNITRPKKVGRAKGYWKVSPDHSRDLMFGLFLGLAAGGGLVFLLERFADRIRTPVEASRQLQLPVLSVVPEVSEVVGRDLDLYSLTRPHSAFAESFRRLRVQLGAVAAFPAEGCGVLLCTSGVPQEGKSLSSIGIAVAAAQSGFKTLLIDADLRGPRVHTTFEEKLTPGLAEVLGGKALWGAVIRPSTLGNLSIMTAGHGGSNPAEILAQGTSFKDLLTRLRGHFERIVIDSPPVAAASDAPLMAPFADAALLVVSARNSRRTASVLARTELSRVGAEPVGLLFNHQDTQAAGYYYTYYHYGRYGYGHQTSEGSELPPPVGGPVPTLGTDVVTVDPGTGKIVARRPRPRRSRQHEATRKEPRPPSARRRSRSGPDPHEGNGGSGASGGGEPAADRDPVERERKTP